MYIFRLLGFIRHLNLSELVPFSSFMLLHGWKKKSIFNSIFGTSVTRGLNDDTLIIVIKNNIFFPMVIFRPTRNSPLKNRVFFKIFSLYTSILLTYQKGQCTNTVKKERKLLKNHASVSLIYNTHMQAIVVYSMCYYTLYRWLFGGDEIFTYA